MHRFRLVTAIAVALAIGWNVIEVTAAAQAGTQAQVLDAPSPVVAHQSSVSRNEASLQFMLANGDALTVSFGSGQVFVERAIGGIRNRQVVAEYERGGELETAWIKLVSEAGRLDPREMLALVRAWQPSALGTEDQKAFESATTALSNLVAAAIAHPEDGAGEIDQDAARDREEAVAGVAGSMSGLEALQALEALRALEGLENLEGLEGLAALEGLESLKGLEEAVRALEQLEAIGGLEPIRQFVRVRRSPLTVRGDRRTRTNCRIGSGSRGKGLEHRRDRGPDRRRFGGVTGCVHCTQRPRIRASLLRSAPTGNRRRYRPQLVLAIIHGGSICPTAGGSSIRYAIARTRADGGRNRDNPVCSGRLRHGSSLGRNWRIPRCSPFDWRGVPAAKNVPGLRGRELALISVHCVRARSSDDDLVTGSPHWRDTGGR